MKYFEIVYYRTHYWIDKKYIKDEYSSGAINKSRVKNIIDVVELTEEEYKTYSKEKRERIQKRKVERFII